MKQAHGLRGTLHQQCVGALAVLLLLAGCKEQREQVPPEGSASPIAPAAPPEPMGAVAPLSALDRADLIAAAAAAADEVAAGKPLPESNLELVNRTFELRLPFACPGANLGKWGNWKLEAGSNVLRISFARQVWTADPLFDALAAATSHDAAEGFWMERPWTRSEDCPKQAEQSNLAATTPAGSAIDANPGARFALVQFFSPDSPRTLRRGNRPYTHTERLSADGGIPPHSFRVKLVGRISGFADGQPIHCVVSQPSHPPTCAASVEFSKVVLEDALSGQSLAEWDA